MCFWIKYQDGNNAAVRQLQVPRSEVTSLMLSEAFINIDALKSVTNCFSNHCFMNVGKGMAWKHHPRVNLTLINPQKLSPGTKVDL